MAKGSKGITGKGGTGGPKFGMPPSGFPKPGSNNQTAKGGKGKGTGKSMGGMC